MKPNWIFYSRPRAWLRKASDSTREAISATVDRLADFLSWSAGVFKTGEWWKAYGLFLGFLILIGAATTLPSQVFFKANGTGAVLRSMASKEGDWNSAADYLVGGVCNGTAIQAAITAAGTTGAVLIPPGCAGTYTNPNNITILDESVAGTLTIGGKTTLRTANNIRFISQFASGSNTGGIAEAYADCPSTGCTIIFDQDVTISSAQTITLVASKDLIIDMSARNLNFTHSSGIGLTISGGLLRQIVVIKNGTFTGNSNTGITGLKLSAVLAPSVHNVVFSGFLGTNQTCTLLDNTQDAAFENVQWLDNNNTGTIALDLANTSNANAYHSVQFQDNTTAIRIRGATSGSYFSDCLIQSQVATNAVVVQATGTDGNITDTHFERCWFESNGDNTANSSSVYFNTDAGKVIQGTSFLNNHFNGNTRGNLGVAYRFSSTGTPGSYFKSSGNTFQSGSYATVQTGWDTTTTQIFSAISDSDGTGTEKFMVGMNSGNDIGLLFKPPGAAATWQLFGGYVNNFDGYLQWFRSGSYIGGVNTTSGWTWGGTQTAPNIQFGNNGKLLNYNGLAVAGVGQPAIYGTPVLLTAQTADKAATNVYASAPVGEYRVCATARTTTSGTGTTSTLNIIWTDEGGAKTDAVGTWALNSVTVTGQINKCEYIHAAASTNIQVSTSGGTYGTSVYALSATAERLN